MDTGTGQSLSLIFFFLASIVGLVASITLWYINNFTNKPPLPLKMWGIVPIVATIVIVFSRLGSLYFDNMAQTEQRFRQPIVMAQATVDVVVESSEPLTTKHLTCESFLRLIQSNEPIMTTSATECQSRQTNQNQMLFQGVFQMRPDDAAVGKPVSSLRRAEQAQVFFEAMAPQAHVLSGKAVLTINSSVQVTMDIPQQNIQKGIILVRYPAVSLPDLPSAH